MKYVIQALAITIVVAMLSGCAMMDDDTESAAPSTPVRYNYGALSFRVKLAYTATFTYTPRDRSDAADYVIGEFQRRLEADGGSYQIAEGEQPDLYVTMTINSDDSNNKTMRLDVRAASNNVPAGTSAGGTTYPYSYGFNTNASYRDVDAMLDDMADRMNGYVANGWWQDVNE